MTDETTIRLHDGRPLITQTSDNGDTVTGWPEVGNEAIRSINHLTQGSSCPAPVVYNVLENLKTVGYMLGQTVTQLGSGLTRSLDEYEISDAASDPAETLARAQEFLAQAAQAAEALGDALSTAQTVLASQGYH